jgi:Fe-S-cluster containining protein
MSSARRVTFDHDDPFTRPLVEGQARITAEALAEDATPAALFTMVDEAHAFGDEAAEEASAALPETARMVPACKAGCAYCCYGTVFASAPEVLRIASHLTTCRPREEVARLAEELAKTAERIAGMTQEERQAARVPCPLLDVPTGRCTVYEVRPFSCRAYNSGDAAACQRAFERGDTNPVLPVNPLLFRGRHAVSFGMMAGCAHGGRDVGPYELTRALADCLARPDAAERWLAGEKPMTHTAASEEARDGYAQTMADLVGRLSAGEMRTLDKHLSRLDPDARRKARNKRKREKRR